MINWLLIGAVLFGAQQDGVELKLESETRTIDPARSVFMRLEVRTAPGVEAALPDLRTRVKGFSLAEDFVEEPVKAEDGSKVQVANWRLVPEPCAAEYKIRPFAVGSLVGGPVYFELPPAREPVTGGMEISPKRDLPPLSWALVGWIALALLVVGLLLTGVWLAVRYLIRRVREHRMSPIERAWVELDRLLKKGLPGRGRYKDFYVELTMVVRRYIQRKYGIRAPHLTTEEFLREVEGVRLRSVELKRFLESSDLVKFAGVEATPDMADGATESARVYLDGDAKSEVKS